MTRRRCLILFWLALAAGHGATLSRGAEEGAKRWEPRAIAEEAASEGETFWRQIGEREPYPTMGIRKVFSYALTLAEARQHPERMERLLAIATQDQDRDPASPGYGNFKWTWQFGTREYCSPTYYGTDLDGLLFIEANARRESAREQARALLELFWTDVALNWFWPKACLAGPHSRSYDYVRGLGSVDRHLWLNGWLRGERPQGDSLLQPMMGRWSPPARLREISRREVPRLVRQSWGVEETESRTHMVYRDVTLGCSGATYGSQDMPLTVDLPGDRGSARCYFIADGREDPYGVKKYETSSARHMKALHLKPCWAGAQRTCDAVGLVVYRAEDLAGDEVTGLESHLVLRRDVGSFRLGGVPIVIPKATRREPGRLAVGCGEPLVFRAGSAAVGIRVLWSRRASGEAAEIALVDDGNPLGVLRLTVDHDYGKGDAVEPAAAFWVRVGSGLDDEAFAAWCRRFEEASPAVVEASDEKVRLEVPGVDGPVSVEAAAPYGSGGRVELVPKPTRAVLELDGEEIGRPLLESLEPVASYRERVRSLQTVEMPAEGGVYWEAEAGLTFPGMVAGEAADASGGGYVWQPADDIWGRATGSVVWPIRVARAGRYWLWGRVFAPNPETDSFYVQVADDAGRMPPERVSWHTGHGDDWRWQAVAADRASEPMPLDLPAGLVRIEFQVREPGTKIDRLFLTPDAGAVPEEGNQGKGD